MALSWEALLWQSSIIPQTSPSLDLSPKSPKKGHIINQKVHSYIVSLESYLQRHLHSYSNKDIDHEEHSNTFWRSHASPCMGHKTEENAWITHLNFDLKIILMTRALHNIFNTSGVWQKQYNMQHKPCSCNIAPLWSILSLFLFPSLGQTMEYLKTSS